MTAFAGTEYLRGLKQQMSASREKKSRQELAGTDYVDPKVIREEEQRQAEKRSNRLYLTIAIIFVVIAVVSIAWKSNFFQKKTTALTIGDQKYTAAEVNYYFQQSYQAFLSQNSYFLSYMGLDVNTDLRDQAYPGGEEGYTWFDFFMDQTEQQMIMVQALNESAAAEGFTWSPEMQAELDASIEGLKADVAASGYYTSFSQYLTSNFGSTMTEKVFMEQTKASAMAQYYANEYAASLDYSEDKLEELYAADPKAYDKVSYQSIRVSGSVPTVNDENGNPIEVSDADKAAAMEAAKHTAEHVYDDLKDGKALGLQAEANEDLYYTNSEGVSYYAGDVLGEWLFDDARKAGDTALLEDETTSAYYVVAFGERFREDYNTVAVRHILIDVDETGLDSTADTYEADLQAKKDEALAEAEALLAQWKSGEATDATFAAMANEYSSDPGSNTIGGLYSQFPKGYMVEEFNDWCFDPARKSGDTGIVYGESTSYKGYHIMYFVDTDLPYWQVTASNALMNEDVTAWYTAKTEGYTAVQENGMRYVG